MTAPTAQELIDQAGKLAKEMAYHPSKGTVETPSLAYSQILATLAVAQAILETNQLQALLDDRNRAWKLAGDLARTGHAFTIEWDFNAYPNADRYGFGAALKAFDDAISEQEEST